MRVLLPLLLCLPAHAGTDRVNAEVRVAIGTSLLVAHAHPGDAATYTAHDNGAVSDTVDQAGWDDLRASTSQADCDSRQRWATYYTGRPLSVQEDFCDIVRGVGSVTVQFHLHHTAGQLLTTSPSTSSTGWGDLQTAASVSQAAFDAEASSQFGSWWSARSTTERETFRDLASAW